jgi:hypothetical protein
MVRSYSAPPWHLENRYDNEYPYGIYHVDEDGIEHDIAMIPNYPETNPVDRVLIGLAPEMADAIDDLIPWINNLLETIQELGWLNPEDQKNLQRLADLRDRVPAAQSEENPNDPSAK